MATSFGKADPMSNYRFFSMLYYGAAALMGTVLLSLTAIAAALAVAVPFALAAGADRFINRHAEPDDRLRSFVIYGLGAVVGLLVLVIFGSRLGWWAFAAPVVGFGVFALVDYVRPPAKYEPPDSRRYGASPPVTAR
jgi:peptidoglycan/LPS O-acetylase OafA/YrhL